MTFSIEVTGLKLPLKYSFTGSSTAGDFVIYFSQKYNKPNSEHHDLRI